MSSHVLDASAVLAWMQQEPGADLVDSVLEHGVISTPTLSEIAQKAAQNGRDVDGTRQLLRALGVRTFDLTEDDAVLVAALWSQARNLSLADRCCLALAHRLQVPAVTADAAWKQCQAEIDILVIR